MQVVGIFGPTAVGKTAVALELAKRLQARGESPIAVSCDALQVYEGLPTLTGTATEKEQQTLEHRLVGFVPITEPFSVGEYLPRAHAEIDQALAANRRPIVVGGTGLYLRAALADLSLVKVPPDTEESELWSPETRHPTLIFGLTMERERLYERIEARVDAIVAAGAGEEVRAAEALGPSHTARKALGFSQLLTGDVEDMKKRSRNYARRQMTWMRKMPDVRRLDMGELSPADAAEEIVHALEAADPAA
ncbi:MAG TPA: tRNA (adenosine(37)-N6)-dimethylallyltransferase MiaA [Thermoleophilaceae bacterium]|nr:tRNA (adenosine(37)-N6)-dimethylallyltransferase MiaA [Thermoleophilaceae bacterium]